ncbi:predicted protein [Chaetoceros tenuissimus]|uniref:Uncharacterized protein n=1 Tax=Chaetoceros tenuissimus TaxID=426638 RepID=A0AAD3D525_9STRA|nr:predicted protein [Chaetoceros tenuissimus]
MLGFPPFFKFSSELPHSLLSEPFLAQQKTQAILITFTQHAEAISTLWENSRISQIFIVDFSGTISPIHLNFFLFFTSWKAKYTS